MASDTKLSTAARNAACDAILGLFEGFGELRVLDGTLPANPQAAEDGVLIASVIWFESDFPAASGGSSSLATPVGELAADSGTAQYFRIRDNLGVVVGQGTCGDAGDAPVDLQFNTVDIVLGGPVTLDTLTLTVPE